MAFYHDDELIDPATQAGIDQLLAMGGMAAQPGFDQRLMGLKLFESFSTYSVF